jgi:hypothetical protein
MTTTTDKIEGHTNGPKHILEKHLELNPEVTIVVSLKDKQITLDISHPSGLADLAILGKFVQLHLDRLMNQRMGFQIQKTETPPESLL